MTHDAHKVAIETEVPFHDVDALQVVWHGHYYKYFELARSALFRSLGIEAAELRCSEHRLLVIESTCRYLHPLHYGDRIRVTAWISERSERVVVSYLIANLTTGERAARGRTALVPVDDEGRLSPDGARVVAQRLRDRGA
jgi:acyl-CoA thioester hydrolase